jgi:hypothetical protein
MNKKKNLVFRYFDTIFSGYKKHGRRPVYMESPHVLYEYKNNDGRVAFEYDTEGEIINFQKDDFYTAHNMLGVSISDMMDLCREYVAEKFDRPDSLTATFYSRVIK